jgi:multisubunit Na+/H+ antiporter MnhB subunit
VYAGHAALALLAKGIRPRISLAVLVPVAFGPDWIGWFLSETGRDPRVLSHSLVSVAMCATVVALIYWSFTRAPVDACFVWLTYASHWPADFITGIKPTWPGGPDVGLLVYNNPALDMLVESTVVVLCWLVYRRSLPRENRNRRLNYLIPVGLCAMQIGSYAIQRPDVKEPIREIIGLAVERWSGESPLVIPSAARDLLFQQLKSRSLASLG